MLPLAATEYEESAAVVAEDVAILAPLAAADAAAHVAEQDPDLDEDLARRDVLMHCLNPDRVVVRGGETEPCAGALADVYMSFGGRVEWYGKPYPAIYRHALGLGGNPPASSVLAVGDALRTDILGAAKMGFDAIFVAGGIHAGEQFPPRRFDGEPARALRPAELDVRLGALDVDRANAVEQP